MSNIIEKRSEPRTTLDNYYSVEFPLAEKSVIYQFKILNVSEHGLCILVKQGSAVLNHLRVGQRINMHYYRNNGPDCAKKIFALPHTEPFMTEVRHITKHRDGYCLVGLCVTNPEK